MRVPAFRVPYVPEAQGSLPPGPHAPYARRTRTSLGRTVRRTYRVPRKPRPSRIANRWLDHDVLVYASVAGSTALCLLALLTHYDRRISRYPPAG